MNIFIFSFNPSDNAKLYCDVHVIKIILEITQLLYTTIHILDSELLISAPNGGYRKTHVNHPVSIWVRQSKSNWLWTLYMGFALCDEYKARGFGKGKEHACRRHLEWMETHVRLNFPLDHFTTPAQAMPDEYKHLTSTTIAYARYMIKGKTVFKNGKVPTWNKEIKIPATLKNLSSQ